MGFLLGGPFYHLQGRTGNNVGRVRKGKNVFSMRPAKTNKPATEAQLNQRIQFGLMNGWLANFASFIKLGFQQFDAKMSAMNAAVRYNMEHALSGVAPLYTIDYPKVMLSKGQLPVPNSMDVEGGTGQSLDFSWGPTSDTELAKPGDLAAFLIFNEDKNRFVVSVGMATRSTQAYALLLPQDFSGDTVRCYVAFVSADKKLVSNSTYLGAMPVG